MLVVPTIWVGVIPKYLTGPMLLIEPSVLFKYPKRGPLLLLPGPVSPCDQATNNLVGS